MPACKICGGDIEFRSLGGVVTPIHISGGCFGKGPSSISQPRSTETYTYDHANDFCRSTTCPRCHRRTFFVRHNGGSVWLDELGWPWPKHPCFDDSTSRGDLHSEVLKWGHTLESPRAAIVIRVAFVQGTNECHAAIAEPHQPTSIWRVFDIPDPRMLVGSLVVFSPADQLLIFRGISYRIAIPDNRCVICGESVLASELDRHTTAKHGVRVCPVCRCYVTGAAFDEHVKNHKIERNRRRRNARSI